MGGRGPNPTVYTLRRSFECFLRFLYFLVFLVGGAAYDRVRPAYGRPNNQKTYRFPLKGKENPLFKTIPRTTRVRPQKIQPQKTKKQNQKTKKTKMLKEANGLPYLVL